MAWRPNNTMNQQAIASLCATSMLAVHMLSRKAVKFGITAIKGFPGT